MKLSISVSMILAAVLSGGSMVFADDISEDSANTMTCGTNFISVGDPVSAVLSTCGEPSSRDGNRWSYSNNLGTFVYQLDVADGNVLSIDTYDRE